MRSGSHYPQRDLRCTTRATCQNVEAGAPAAGMGARVKGERANASAQGRGHVMRAATVAARFFRTVNGNKDISTETLRCRRPKTKTRPSLRIRLKRGKCARRASRRPGSAFPGQMRWAWRCTRQP